MFELLPYRGSDAGVRRRWPDGDRRGQEGLTTFEGAKLKQGALVDDIVVTAVELMEGGVRRFAWQKQPIPMELC